MAARRLSAALLLAVALLALAGPAEALPGRGGKQPAPAEGAAPTGPEAAPKAAAAAIVAPSSGAGSNGIPGAATTTKFKVVLPQGLAGHHQVPHHGDPWHQVGGPAGSCRAVPHRRHA
jgi:hypothetical protein